MTDDPKQPEEQPDERSQTDETPAEAFRKGMGFLWKAARGVADEIKREVEKGGVSDALQQAGRELEEAATHAAKAVESFIDRSGPKPPSYQDRWPPTGGTTAPDDEGGESKMADGDIPEDGGVDEEGRPRDMRIQVDPDDEA
ncbi:MAG TPA: hypothetical protein ENK57_10130 [Polyangiaceae bacterium]|nr:hypothetical protein [Polyangiaceae bacterium]